MILFILLFRLEQNSKNGRIYPRMSGEYSTVFRTASHEAVYPHLRREYG
jgi:hypothetical protein